MARDQKPPVSTKYPPISPRWQAAIDAAKARQYTKRRKPTKEEIAAAIARDPFDTSLWEPKGPPPCWGESGIPRFPSGLGYHHPPPPALTERHALELDAGVLFLERWYNAALGSRYTKTHPVRAPKAGGTRVYWELAVETCLNHDIRPGAWVAFSIDEWRVVAPQRALKSPPDVKFVFGPRMQSRLWMYRDMEGKYAPSRELYTPDARSVLDRLHEIRAFGARAGWVGEDATLAELKRLFPLGFEQEVRAAQRTTQATEAVLKQQVRQGKWIWEKDLDGKAARALAARRPDFNEGAHG